MPKKKGTKKGGKKKVGTKKKSKKSASKKPKAADIEAAQPPPGPDEEHDVSCACRHCLLKVHTVVIHIKIVTQTGIDHPSNLEMEVPDWTLVSDIQRIACQTFYQIPGDVTLYMNREAAAEGAAPLDLDYTLAEQGMPGGDIDEPPEHTVWMAENSALRRFGYTYYMGRDAA